MAFEQVRRRACAATQRMSKATFLAMLPSNIDLNEVRVVATGEIISISDIAERDVQRNVNNGIWERIERAQPRKLYVELADEDWSILSFNPERREVCVEVRNPRRTITTSHILPDLSNSSKTSLA